MYAFSKGILYEIEIHDQIVTDGMDVRLFLVKVKNLDTGKTRLIQVAISNHAVIFLNGTEFAQRVLNVVVRGLISLDQDGIAEKIMISAESANSLVTCPVESQMERHIIVA